MNALIDWILTFKMAVYIFVIYMWSPGYDDQMSGHKIEDRGSIHINNIIQVYHNLHLNVPHVSLKLHLSTHLGPCSVSALGFLFSPKAIWNSPVLEDWMGLMVRPFLILDLSQEHFAQLSIKARNPVLRYPQSSQV